MPIRLTRLCELLNGELVGDGSVEVSGIAEIESAGSGQITFLVNKRYAKYLKSSEATAVIISEDMQNPEIPAIKVTDVQIAKAKTLEFFYQPKEYPKNIDSDAHIGENAQVGKDSFVGAGSVIKNGAVLGKNCCIMENVFIDSEVTIGNESVIHPGAVIISDTTIGNRVEIGPGSVIGSEGFGYLPDNGKILKVPQIGSVIIEDDVSIGANCCVDRGTMGATLIRKGVKLDNLIQVAHNVEIGEYTIIAAQAGVSGSTKIGSGVLIGGQSAIVGHLKIGNGVKIGGRAGVTKSFPDGAVISGEPARIHTEALAKDANLSRIPKLVKRIKELENEILKIKTRLDKDE